MRFLFPLEFTKSLMKQKTGLALACGFSGAS